MRYIHLCLLYILTGLTVNGASAQNIEPTATELQQAEHQAQDNSSATNPSDAVTDETSVETTQGANDTSNESQPLQQEEKFLEPSSKDPKNVALEAAENLLFRTENGEEIVYDRTHKLFTGATNLPDKDNTTMIYYYKDGKKNGIAASYYDNMKIRKETTYVNGHKNGAEAMFAKDGNAIYQCTYKDDIKDGEEILFHAGGKPRQRSFYVNGELNGKVQYFDQAGVLNKIENYQNGIKNGKEEIIENGRLKKEYMYVDGKISGTVKKYNDKYLVEEIEYQNGVPEGIGKIYAEDGGITEIPYINGMRQGLSTVYFPNKKIKQKIWYINDKKNGVQETFYPNGTVLASEYYKNNHLEGTARYFDEEGNLTNVKHYVEGAQMAEVDLTTDTALKEIYDSYKSGQLSHYSTKRNYWYSILWLALNTGKSDILQALEKELKMYVLALDNIAVYQQSSDDFDDVSGRLYFGLTPLGYAINMAAPNEILQRFISQLRQRNPRGTTALQEAIRLNNAEIVKYLIANGADIETSDDQGNTALLYALKSHAQPEIISILLQNGADIRVKDAKGNLPISYALEQNHSSEIIANLLSAGSSLSDITLSSGETPLLHALKTKQSPEIIQTIMSALPFRAQETDKNGHSALFYALHNDYPQEIVERIILLYGADFQFDPADILPELVRKQDTELLKKINFPFQLTTNFAEGEFSDLWYAYEHDAPHEMIDYLWERGVEKHGVNYLTTAINGDSLFLAAERKNDKFMAMHLIEAGILNQSTPEQKQKTVAYVLTNPSDEKVINAVIDAMDEADLSITIDNTNRPLWKHLLLNRKFDLLRKLVTKFKELPNLEDENGKSMVELAVDDPQNEVLTEFVATNAPVEALLSQALKGNNPELLQFMIQKVGDVNQTDAAGQTLLIRAIESQAKPEIIELLLNAGANVEYADSTGKTAFFAACKLNQVETARILLKHGANVNAVVDGTDCLMSLNGAYPEMLELLIENQVAPTFKNSVGVTVLMNAVKNLDRRLIDYALEQQADIKAKDDEGNNVLSYLSMATGESPQDILEVLQQLLQAAADVNNRNYNGETVLILFAQKHPELYLQAREMLVQSGAEVDLKDQYGKTADDYFAHK